MDAAESGDQGRRAGAKGVGDARDMVGLRCRQGERFDWCGRHKGRRRAGERNGYRSEGNALPALQVAGRWLVHRTASAAFRRSRAEVRDRMRDGLLLREQ